MLFAVGALQFTPGGLNPHEYSRQASADFAEKEVVGVLKPAEFVGEGDDILKLVCKVFTREQRPAMGIIASLDEMRLSGQSQICVRGDGYSYGWRRVTDIQEKSRYPDLSGVGKVIEYEITLKKSRRPSAAGMLSFLYNLLS